MADAPQQGEPREVSREEARKMVDEGAQLIDVRADHEWEVGRIAGATHIPLPELPQRTEEIDKDRPVVIYCRGGNRSSMASAALGEAGFDAVKLSEGIVGWKEAELPIEPVGGYVADSGEASAILQAQKKPSHS
ncbi:MAG TPA: rhodanese-like domain-containing protein [Solirubrobacterales bacterium]|nr:rhodanese-like domain-containing protein [Solirubrobacterales bacterium]